MSSTDVLEIFIGQVLIDDNVNGGESIDGLLSISWHHPRENVAWVSSVIPLNSLTNNYNKVFSELSYMDRILFKEQRRGISFFSLELAIVTDLGLFGKVMKSLMGFSIGKVPNRYIAAGLKPILRELKLDETQTKIIGVAKYQLEAEQKDINLNVSLKAAEELVYYREKGADEVNIDPGVDEVMEIIPENTETAMVRLDVVSL
ncbi:MAG: hypothetical protein ACC707_18695 [Thiohalomonadales bacterium]